jgi:hypothetical protein
MAVSILKVGYMGPYFNALEEGIRASALMFMYPQRKRTYISQRTVKKKKSLTPWSG